MQSDNVAGTSRADVLLLRAGPDVGRARGGNDRVRGQRGHDRLYGGRGADRLWGGPGRDVLGGGPGRDFLNSVDGARDGRIQGGAGRDTCRIDKRDAPVTSGCERLEVVDITAASRSTDVTPPAGGPWRLAFSDEFNDTELDTAKWDWKYPRSGDKIYSNWSNGEAQWYKRENMREGNGYLSLIAKREKTVSPFSGSEFDYTSGLIQSKPSFNFRYGYMEARVRLPAGSGFWPAFWTWSSNEQWPPEIDAMEFYGDNPELTYLTYHGNNGATGTTVRSSDWTTGWHTFAVDWQPGRLTWYVDGIERKTVGEAPNLDMYLIANLAIANGARAPAPNLSTPFPSELKIDYIRVWKRT